MTNGDEIRWYALRTFHNKASVVCREATSAEVEWFTPEREVEEVVDGRVTTRREALMPSLLFLRCTVDYIARLRRTTGDNILPYCYPRSARPQPIDDGEMEIFRLVTRTAARTLELVDDAELDNDKRVRITGGLFAGSEGYIRRVRGTKRFVVRIEGIAAIATTYIPRQYIEPIEPLPSGRLHNRQ